MPDSVLSTLPKMLLTSQQPYKVGAIIIHLTEGKLRLDKIKPLAQGPEAGLQICLFAFRAQHVVVMSMDPGAGPASGRTWLCC